MQSQSRYAPTNAKNSNKRPLGLFFLIIFILGFTATINLPKIPINKTIFGKKIESIGGYESFSGRDVTLRRGLDLQGGIQLTLQADMKGIEEKDRQSALDSARNVIDRRVNLYGVSEPVVQSAKTGNDYRIIVELPGLTNTDQALDLVGRTAKLEFREPIESSSSATASGSATLDPELEKQLEGLDASSAAYFRDVLANQPKYKPTDLTGSELKRAEVTFNQRTGEAQVSLEFKDKGTKLFGDLTTKYLGKQIAIYLDDQLVSAPTVNSAIIDGHAVITGNFTVESAKQLATQLNAGALPVPVKVIEQRAVGATLGDQSVSRSITAGAIGFILIALFMIVLYRYLGLIAVFALILYSLITLTVFRFIPVTLTLAGIAGFLLSVGMALDANILIFERMREEMRWGKGKKEALRLGFDRAWSSIRDSNVSSLITCFILYSFGTGLVRGFALTLALGILISMFTAITVTRTLLRMFYK